MSRLLLLCLVPILALVNGCIDGEEELFVERDGSARVMAVYRIPGVFFSAEDAEELRLDIARELGQAKHLKLLTNRVDKQNSSRVITLEVATDDISSLEGLLSEHTLEKAPSKADKVLHAIVGRIKVDVHGLSASFSRQIDIAPLLLDYMGDDGLSMLGEAQFRYTIHLPKAVTTSNAHEVSNDGRTLRWVYQLAENKDKPIMLSMVASVPVPWWVWALAVLLVLALLWGLRILTGRLRSQGGRSSSM